MSSLDVSNGQIAYVAISWMGEEETMKLERDLWGRLPYFPHLLRNLFPSEEKYLFPYIPAHPKFLLLFESYLSKDVDERHYPITLSCFKL